MRRPRVSLPVENVVGGLAELAAGLVVWWVVGVAMMAVAVVLTITSGAEFFRQVLTHRRQTAASASP